MTQKKILIVDDDNKNVFALSAVLRSRKFICLTALGMKDAFVLLEKEPVDMLLLDMMMPDMDGYEALAALRENPSYANLPIVAVTAQAMKGDKERCLQAGASAYVSKPVNIDELMQVLKQWIDA